ncbi:transposable element Tcb2 transposase [Trichonephila clavipes]|nr:transposable element Tcb2 transposase [Trichonephila clavipes]
MSTMSQRSHLTDSGAWRVVGRLEGGQTQAEIAQAIEVSQSVISRIWNRFLETGSAGRRPGQGRRRATTPNKYRYLVLTARRHRNMNATLLLQHLRSATGTTVSTQTVRNRLHDEAQKPSLPDSIDHPIAAMPPSRMQNSTLVMPLIEDLSRYGIEDCSYSPEAQKSNAYSTPIPDS